MRVRRHAGISQNNRVEEAPSTKKAIYALADFMQAGYGDKVIK